ncbi:glycosyltransferase family 2 protein [Winogradskyella maritima]|uniref:Glycosyltransferase family 2 protein n=1 Tax=Winogradskyella maritima TaxID=1517766 RepID=A0ABV8AJV6_9FLAO|nr:glycosyltransferase family 2 protein [Winogradskyella maritima]
MKLSVVILNYNVKHFLQLCLQSVEAGLTDLDAEIIVVDNDSEDGSAEMISKLFPNVKLIETGANLGFSKGNNIGVAEAKGEYVCILNPDTMVAEDTFKTLLEVAESQENLGILGCQLIDGAGHFLPESKRNIPTPSVALKKVAGHSESYYANTVATDGEGEVAILVGAFMLLRKSVYETVGGFDEDYFMYGEDIDLSYKVLQAGFQNYYYGKTTVLHFKGESTVKDGDYAKRFYGAMSLFYKKHFKGNVATRFAVDMASKLGGLTFKPSSVTSETPEHFMSTSEDLPSELKEVWVQDFGILDYSDMKPNTQVLFDANHMSFKSIIDQLKINALKEKIRNRIWPKNSNFILGSDSASSRGEVLEF